MEKYMVKILSGIYINAIGFVSNKNPNKYGNYTVYFNNNKPVYRVIKSASDIKFI